MSSGTATASAGQTAIDTLTEIVRLKRRELELIVEIFNEAADENWEGGAGSASNCSG